MYFLNDLNDLHSTFLENNLTALLLFPKPGVFNLLAACGLPHL